MFLSSLLIFLIKSLFKKLSIGFSFLIFLIISSSTELSLASPGGPGSEPSNLTEPLLTLSLSDEKSDNICANGLCSYILNSRSVSDST